jgi:hypothetical protein
MECEEARERILDSLAEAAPSMRAPDVAGHLLGCPACRSFSELQNVLDVQLRTAIGAPAPSPAFRKSLAKSIRREPVSVWPAFLPDIAHMAGCLSAIVLCIWLLPFAAGPVVLNGLALTLVTWFAQSVVQCVMEIRGDEDPDWTTE